MMISCRAETPEDEPFVRQLVIDFVTEDLAAWSWPQPMRDHLVDVQYRARRQSVRSNSLKTDSRIIMVDGRPAGWLALSESGEGIHIVEIIVGPEHRGKGVGSKVLKDILRESERAAKSVRLTVRNNNRAVRLYERLGFQKVAGDEIQHFMERPAGASNSE